MGSRGFGGARRSTSFPAKASSSSSAPHGAFTLPTASAACRRSSRLDGGPEEIPPARNTAVVSADGPIYLRGQIEVVTPEGEPIITANRLALCRCGASERKPLCDGSHRRTRFRDPGALLKVDPPRTDLDQRLQVVVSERGPFQLRGPVTIVSGSGEARTEGDRRSLCRCGASREKPFCDGSHNTIGVPG
jgi:CDGSH-type Zn-finger protein